MRFQQFDATRTLMSGEVTGLTPGLHGIHVHTFGDLSDGCASTGGHYNPRGAEFEDENAGGYIGNLGNIEADRNGVARFSILYPDLDLGLTGEPFSILSRSIVVHADEDGGARVACGVIGTRNE